MMIKSQGLMSSRWNHWNAQAVLSFVVALLVSDFFLDCNPVCAQPPSDVKALGDFVISGWIEQRDRIKSAVYEVDGEYSKDNWVTVRSPFKIKTWMSGDTSRIESRWGKYASSWIQFEDHFVGWNHGISERSTIVIMRNDQRKDEDFARVDPRVAPWFGYTSLPDRFPPYSQVKLAWLHTIDVAKAQEVEPNVFELWVKALVGEGQPARWSKLVFEGNRGFSLVLSESYDQPDGMAWPGLRTTEFRTSWKEIQGIWVPVNMTGVAYNNVKGQESKRQEVRISVAWEHVNEVVPEVDLSIASFAAKDGHRIMDLRAGETKPIDAGKLDRSKPNAGLGFDAMLEPGTAKPQAKTRPQ